MRLVARIMAVVVSALVLFPAWDVPASVPEDPRENEKCEAAILWHELDGVTVTAYCPCEACSGGWGRVTASGTRAREGVIAVDPEVIPLGAWVEIGGVQYIAEDTGGDVTGKHIDVFFESHADAESFGARTDTVRWYCG